MPIYEFTCKDCGGDCELLVRNLATRPVCPDCGGRRLEKRMSLFAARGSRGSKSSCSSCTSSSCATCRR